MFNFLRQCQTVFYSSYVILHSHQQWTRVKFIYILISICYFFSLEKNPGSMKWYLVLICISPMTNDVHYFFFMFLLAICVSYLKKLLIKSFTHLKIGLFVFLLQSCKSSLYILDMRSLSGWQIFSPIL